MKLAMKLGRLEIALAALVAAGLAGGCKKDGGDQSDDGEAGASSGAKEEGAGGLSYDPASEKSYKVRGLVQSDIRDGVVMIHHEKIPDFANRQNEVKGMMSMAMGFGIEDGVDASVLAKGAKIALEFDVRWKQNPPLRITSATALDPATELDFAGGLPTKAPGGHEHGSGQGGGGGAGEGGHEHGSGQGGGGGAGEGGHEHGSGQGGGHEH